MSHSTDGPEVRRWLVVVLAMIFAMVVIGGATRLTGSGLSMVEWRPLMGALPPIGDEQWASVFDRYKQFPQYQKVNDWMTLSDFKSIFMWEYVHRLVGRLIGLVVVVPWLYFVARGRMSRSVSIRSFMALIFGGLQGVLGWYMVRSGLVDIPAVSHYRLASHLLLAAFVGMWVWWIILDLRPVDRSSFAGADRLHLAAWGFVGLVTVQITYGAFMAGSRAGLLFSTFPDMNGAMLPGPFMQDTTLSANLLDNPAVIHWMHRTLAYVVLAYVAVLAAAIRRRSARALDRRRVGAMVVVVLLQGVLGAATVMLHVPVVIAVVHQFVAIALLALAVGLAHGLARARAD